MAIFNSYVSLAEGIFGCKNMFSTHLCSLKPNRKMDGFCHVRSVWDVNVRSPPLEKLPGDHSPMGIGIVNTSQRKPVLCFDYQSPYMFGVGHGRSEHSGEYKPGRVRIKSRTKAKWRDLKIMDTKITKVANFIGKCWQSMRHRLPNLKRDPNGGFISHRGTPKSSI